MVAFLYGLGPVPRPHHLAGVLHLVAQAQQQRQSVLGHRVLAVVGHVAHRHPGLPGCGHVDGVVAVAKVPT